MKEIALAGTSCRVFADVMGELLGRGMSIDALVDFPEKVMVADTRLNVNLFPVDNHNRLVESFTGYDTVVLTYNDVLTDTHTNDLTLRYFSDTMHAAREAGVKRVIVVGSPNSEAFFAGDLRRLDDIDWVFISTEGPFACRVADEIERPSLHKAVYGEYVEA